MYACILETGHLLFATLLHLRIRERFCASIQWPVILAAANLLIPCFAYLVLGNKPWAREKHILRLKGTGATPNRGFNLARRRSVNKGPGRTSCSKAGIRSKGEGICLILPIGLLISVLA